MRGAIDLSSWEGLLSTLVGVAVFSFVVVGIRLLVMHTVQLKRERENRQINERLRTLIAAYKTLGGSFTGNLAVDPAHLRDLQSLDRRNGKAEADPDGAATSPATAVQYAATGSDRRRRIRDAVEAALSDVILLGTEEQVRLAAKAANDMVAGRSVETADLVVSLRTFIRQVLDLDAIAADVAVPRQGPARPGEGGGRGARGERGQERGGQRGGGGQGAGGGLGGMGFGGGDQHSMSEVDPTDHH